MQRIKTNQDAINDITHWQNLKPPLAPNQTEIEIYKDEIIFLSPVVLLGMTKELVPLCDVAVDLNPVDIGKPTIKSDWYDFEFKSRAIISDGAINFTGLELVDRVLQMTNKFVCRVFLKKLPGMKYATYFPSELPGARVISTQQDVVIAIWESMRGVL